MRRLVEPAVFLGLASALHASVWIGFGGGGAPAWSGAGAGAAVVVEAASPATAALVRRWEAPPERAPDPAIPAAPSPVAGPALPMPPATDAPVAVATPEALAAPGQAEGLPRVETFVAAPVQGSPEIAMPAALAEAQAPALARTAQAAAPPAKPTPPDLGAPAPAALTENPPDAEAARTAAPSDPVRPRPRSERRASRPPEAAAPSAPAQPSQTAAAVGAPEPAAAGSGSGGEPALGVLRALEAEWGAAILSRIARQQRYPAGDHGSGTARVTLTVSRDGRLRDLRLAASSGSAALDRAALEAVRRAGRFPAAPRELDDGVYVFAVPMTFRRN